MMTVAAALYLMHYLVVWLDHNTIQTPAACLQLSSLCKIVAKQSLFVKKYDLRGKIISTQILIMIKSDIFLRSGLYSEYPSSFICESVYRIFLLLYIRRESFKSIFKGLYTLTELAE